MTPPQGRAKGRVQADVQRVVYSVREFAAATGYAIDTVYRAMHSGELPFFKLRGEYRIPAECLQQMVAKAKADAEARQAATGSGRPV